MGTCRKVCPLFCWLSIIFYRTPIIQIIDGDLWNYYKDSERQEGDEGITATIVHKNYIFVNDYQDNTNDKVFGLVDRMIYYCCYHYSTDWIGILKKSIKSLLNFFDANEQKTFTFNYHDREDERLARLFNKTYSKRKEWKCDFIYDDPETKIRFSQINDSYTTDEIDILIENKEFVKRILQTKEYSAIQKIIEEFPETDFSSILNILRKEQGDFSIERVQQNISDERKREIGDKGECYVYEMLCNRFGSTNVIWSNFSPNDESARLVRFNGRYYHLKTTSHDFDFIISYKGKTIYVEVKTTVGNIKSSKDFPLIFETKEWEWIDFNRTDNALHYIVRVFDVENNPKAYFLKQELNVG